MADKLTVKLEMLERTVLELGTELYNVKGRMAKAQDSHEQVFSILKGLKQLLDEKGLVTVDDFDAAVELGEALESFHAQANPGLFEEMEKAKKAGN